MGRSANKQDLGDWTVLAEGEQPEFVGYDELTVQTRVLRYRQVTMKSGAFYQIVLEKTPFYAEMGGEVGDTGTLGNVAVIDCKRENGLNVCITKELPADLEGELTATVNAELRQAIACNHSATHILHYALRQVLGEHVEQKGSLVTPDSLRFDFSHFQKVTPEELRKAEMIANQLIRKNLPLEEHRHTPIAEAKAMGAMALFGEKYGDDVRVIKYGPSIELCGGCHVHATGEIGVVRIIMETSIAAGIRRIEAITAAKVDEAYYVTQDMLNGLRLLFNNAPDLAGAIHKTIEESTGLKKQIEEFMAEKIVAYRDQLISRAEDINGIKLVRVTGPADNAMIRAMLPLLKGKFTDVKFAVIATTVQDDKPQIALFLSQPLVEAGLNAGALIKSAAKHIQGGGGGAPQMATAGGRSTEGLPAAMDELLHAIVG